MVYTWYMNDEFLTLKEAMDFLGIKSRITMRKYADSGTIPSERIETPAGKWRGFKKADLIAFKKRMVKDPIRGMSYLPLMAPPSRDRTQVKKSKP